MYEQYNILRSKTMLEKRIIVQKHIKLNSVLRISVWMIKIYRSGLSMKID